MSLLNMQSTKFMSGARSSFSLVDGTNTDTPQELIVVSPYASRSHLMDMSTLDMPNQLMTKALTLLRSLRNDYATAPYTSSFNWSAVVSSLAHLAKAEEYTLRSQEFYIVVFRSQIPPTSSRTRLAELDEESHLEAMESGGLLKYWFGEPDVTGRNLATCKVISIQLEAKK